MTDIQKLKAEIERLQHFEAAYKEFSDKTDWVQETAHWSELGMHRADVLRKRVDQLKAENTDLHATLQAAKGEIERLKGENEALRAEAAKWKNESVSDSQTIYSLSCNLAQRTGEVRELADVVDDLSALTKRFVQRLRKAAPGNDLPEKALDYLKRKGLQGSTMREIVEGRLS
jgi:predicted RNase H-like nuclease (RuvC/YqgF family)